MLRNKFIYNRSYEKDGKGLFMISQMWKGMNLHEYVCTGRKGLARDLIKERREGRVVWWLDGWLGAKEGREEGTRQQHHQHHYGQRRG